jgi:hypothetical protein
MTTIKFDQTTDELKEKLRQQEFLIESSAVYRSIDGEAV